MKRIGMFALSAMLASALQGCIFAPVESDGRNDPFFFDPDDVRPSANFVEVGYYQPNAYLPPSSSRQCSVDSELRKVGSPCWFFPIMRVY
ncbi:hypothetical protein [Microbulbifer yueqingensis]|uniref:Lipoprotein n=1 Tax=Microbulbifer yueqingensis TaxID=658219 RepID=A0A1G8VS93_9GAMM|nr:hypothetical protein [Microbulbifer yueqingensis]SDJ68892.1 hypothetical protein SAMN05216212_0707 [Microbulbifer yueqingensis]